MARPDVERLEREDLAMFINACFACTGQAEYYADSRGHDVAIDFLHEYILGNYRRLYARTAAAGINHFNQALVVTNLLAAGSPRGAADRAEEGSLIAEVLRRLPTPRAWKLLAGLRDRKVNNRRARAVAREYLELRRDPAFDAVKYRPRVRAAARHAHPRLPGELAGFLFGNPKRRKDPYATPLLEWHRRARTEPEALYHLPYTVAEGFAARHRVPREAFLERIEPMLTATEKLRLQGAARDEGAHLPADLRRVDLTRLCLYALSLPDDERAARAAALDDALRASADRALRRAPMQLGRVAAVLDRSHSAGGSREKRHRPLAVALGASYLLAAAAREFRPFWTPALDVDAPEVTVRAGGTTALAAPLVDALAWGAELVVIVSDGYENAPKGGVAEVLRVLRDKLDPERKVSVVHVNPVFDQERFAPRALAHGLATVGLRDAEDLLTMLGFARFADGTGSLAELEAYLAGRVKRFLRVPEATERPHAEALDEDDP